MGVIAPEKKSPQKNTLLPLLIFVAFAVAIPSLAIHAAISDSAKKSNSAVEKNSASSKTLPVNVGSMPVLDNADILSATEENSINEFLLALDRTTGVQIAVLTVKNLGDETIEELSLRYAESLKLGQAGKDNGALLTISMQEHAVRIETGYGTEAALTDAKCARIIRNIIVPSFQNSKYADGIFSAVKNMAGIITSDESLVSDSVKNSSSSSRSDVLPLPVILFLFVFGCFYFGTIIYGITHRKRGFSTVVPGAHIHTSSHSFSGGGFHGGGGGFHGGGGGFGGGGASGHW